MNRILFLIIICAITFSAQTQQTNLPAFGLNDLEQARQFEDWRSEVDLSNSRGWKWFARHKNFQDLHGGAAVSSLELINYYTELQRVSKEKAVTMSAARSGHDWSPAGPVNRPPGVSNFASHNLGRINCLAFHPADSNIIYVGVAQGGVWKTENHGASWRPLTDDLPIIRISDVSINPANPDEMYICLGDYAYIGVALNTDGRKRNTHYGMGVYRSEDGGENWSPTNLGFNQESLDASLMRRVIFDTIPGRAIAAGVSGIWETLDSGQTWNQIMDSLIWDIESDPNIQGTIYMTTGYVANLDLGSAEIWKSIDYGRTWAKLNSGIPTKDAQRIEVTVAPSNSNYVYAIACDLQRGLQGVYRSTDAGASWTLRASYPNILEWTDGAGTGGQGTYDLCIMVDPNDPDRIYTGGVNIWGSEDGGLSWKGASYWYHRDGWSTHADQHYFKFNPLDQKFYVCNDGGLYRTDSIGLTPWPLSEPWNTQWPTDWENITDGMQITAFYRLDISDANPGNIIAGAQDNGTYFKMAGNWKNVNGGDGMDCMLDPSDPNVIYMSSQYGNLVRSTNGGSFSRSISRNIPSNEEGGWTTPMEMHPVDSTIIYAGYGNLYRSFDRGDFWTPMSAFPNLSGRSYSSPITAFDLSAQNPEKIYLAKRVYFEYNEPSSIWLRENNNWKNITAGLPDSLYPTSIEIHEANDDTAWVSFAGLTSGLKVFETRDGGDSWNNISAGLPNVPVNVIKRQHYSAFNTMYAGTDIGIYYKNDTTTQWELYSDGLPNVIVSDVEIHYNEEKIYASTFGRGIWVADLTDSSAFPPPDTSSTPDTNTAHVNACPVLDFNLYPNPNSGAFRLEAELAAANDLRIEIIDVTGRLVYSEQIPETQKMIKDYSLELESGQYYLRLINGGKSKVRPFSVTKR